MTNWAEPIIEKKEALTKYSNGHISPTITIYKFILRAFVSTDLSYPQFEYGRFYVRWKFFSVEKRTKKFEKKTEKKFST